MKNKASIFLRYIVPWMIVLILINLVIAAVSHIQFQEYSIWELFWIYLSGSESNLPISNTVGYVLLSLKRLLDVTVMAILASFAFSVFLNKEVKIIFPEKLVVRRRTSEGSNGKITLGILVGNPGQDILYDVKCSIICSYVKETGKVVTKNSDVMLEKSVVKLLNYYRFSFEVSEFHKQFWKDYLERSEDCMAEDYVYVTISGRCNSLGGNFIAEKRYTLSEIGIDLRNPEKSFKYTYTNPFTGKSKTKINWKEFPRFIEAGELSRAEVIEEIKQYAYEQTPVNIS